MAPWPPSSKSQDGPGEGSSPDSGDSQPRSWDEHDLPGDVAGFELGERRSDIVERGGALNRHDVPPRRDRRAQFGQRRPARGGRPALTLDAVLLDGREVDDRVDPILGDAELERELDVAAADEADER